MYLSSFPSSYLFIQESSSESEQLLLLLSLFIMLLQLLLFLLLIELFDNVLFECCMLLTSAN